jgi:hypothetical protein
MLYKLEMCLIEIYNSTNFDIVFVLEKNVSNNHRKRTLYISLDLKDITIREIEETSIKICHKRQKIK